VANTEELEVVISLIQKKALTEAHYCETYADLVYHLKTEMPEFPSPDGGKPVSFKSTLLNVTQNEFEMMQKNSLDATPEELARNDPEELEFLRKQRKGRVLANMKFIGNLFLRQLLTARIIGSIIQDLAMCEDADTIPPEHVVECLCELLLSIGYTLESMPAGQAALKQVCFRLVELKGWKDKKGKQAYSKRIQFTIQDLLDVRNAGWAKKVFKAGAKTKEEIKQEQTREINAQAAGKVVPSGEQVIVGARPAYLDAPSGAGGSSSGGKPGAGGEAGEWQEIPTKTRR